ncbi:tyrosine recombinase XerC [Agrilactobacillus yilanensis]|uniref:Tyrosine recombinase XerC n=1 Tax=Agrilactobacillus yilanensis TaxID=2485997 RepID=A0ABW4JAP9_9LACO|nr:tyrosine recombinase XerC [Agrilactobacillus yilanensis]
MFENNWVAQFLDYLTYERQYSQNTVAAYRRDIENFEKIVQTNDKVKSFDAIDSLDVSSFLNTLDQQKLAASTIARKVSSLRTFYNYLNQQKLTPQTPFSGVITKKRPKRLPKFFYSKEMNALLKATDGDKFADKRDKAIIELLYATGIRAFECVNLTLDQIDWQQQVILVHGKGNKDRYVPFGKYAKAALEIYLTQGRENLLTSLGLNHNIVFVNQRGNPLTTRGLSYILDQRIKKTPLTSSIHPHMIRHTFATQMLEHGADLRTVQELLGHTSLSSTQIYTHVTMAHLQRDYRKYFPRAND